MCPGVIRSVDTNPYQYTGRENDGDGLYFYRNRYYNPTLQRFISDDPIGAAGGINLYAYVENNPNNFVDPLGTDKRQPSGLPPGYSHCGDFVCDPYGNHVAVWAPGLSRDPIFDAAVGVGAGWAAGAASAALSDTADTVSIASEASAADDAAAYQQYWDNLSNRAPVQSSPYDVVPKYDADGNLTGATTYDQYGNRAYQYEFDPGARHGPGYHSYDNSGPYTGYGNGPRSPHIIF